MIVRLNLLMSPIHADRALSSRLAYLNGVTAAPETKARPLLAAAKIV
jgi:hypothetical protein